MKRWALLLTLACGCSSKPNNAGTTGGGSSGGTAPVVANAKTCADVKAKVEQMYRVEAQANEPKRVDEAVADNTTMVMNDCAREPAKFVPCIANAKSVAELEKQCLVPLDDEGTEGEQR